MNIRPLREEDYGLIMSRLDAWWNGRNMVDQLPSLFVRYFADTCLVAEIDGDLAGFLIGFMAQSDPDVAYVHFAGVNPDYRRRGVGQGLYDRFAQLAAKEGRSKIRSVTSTVNRLSHAFHSGMGFQLKDVGDYIDGIPYVKDYDGPGKDRFCFELKNPHV